MSLHVHRPHLHRPTDRHVAEFCVWLAAVAVFAAAVTLHMIGGTR